MRKYFMMAFMVMVVSMMAAGHAIAADVNAVFMAGAAKADITPEVFPLTRAPKVTITGVLDSLTVRVIALSKGPTTVLLIASETGRSFGPVFAKAIARHTALPLENIILTSTHTHAAPEITEHDSVLIADMLQGKKAPKDLAPDKANLLRWARKSYDNTLAAVDAALRSRRPAAVGIGYTESYINVNRNSLYVDTRDIGWNPAGETDHTLAVVNIVDSNGNSIACIMHYAVHGTVMHANTCMPDGGTAVSADIPGIVSGYMEQRHPGIVAMWLSGAAGDQNPIIQNNMYAPSPKTGKPDETFNNDTNILYFLSKIHFADAERALESVGEYRQNPDLAISYIADSIPAKRTGTVGINLQVMRLGDIGFACFSGELYSPTGRYMKEHAVLSNTLVVNHCWQRPEQINGYCADDWTLRNGGFGLRQASFAPGHLNTTLTRMMNSCFEKQGLPTYQKGDIIYFGAYPQRAGEPNGRPRLAWRVLDVGKDGTLTLITDKIIDIVPFNLNDADGNEWSHSNLRAWLNSKGGSNASGDTEGFYNMAFNEMEKKQILTSKVAMHSQGKFIAFNRLKKGDNWEYYTTEGDSDTEDKVYALSGEEIFSLFGLSKRARFEELGYDPHNYTGAQAKGTAYAVSMGLKVNDGRNGPSSVGYADYWTRSKGAQDPGKTMSCGVFLGSTGSLNVGRSVTRLYGVRPVIRVKLPR